MTESSYRVAFYCPDTNLKLDGNIPDVSGLGGGKTAVIKLAHALQSAGNGVSVYAHCNEGIYQEVEYVDFRKVNNLVCDVLIAITGHKCDISELYEEKITARLKVLWLSGSGFIRGIDDNFFDFYYANSVFLKKRAIMEWGLPFEKVVSTHQGYDPQDFKDIPEIIERNSSGIVFASHPHKGLDRTVEIIDLLRRELNSDLTLDVYGGYRLWNDSDGRELPFDHCWIKYRGMVPQPELCKRLFEYGFMFHLTDYEDTSSILIQQAKRAGLIVIASDVGGNSELIENGYDGFIIEEKFRDKGCYEKVRRLVGHLLSNRDYADYIRANAQRHSLTWDKTAGQWIGHWEDVLGEKVIKRIIISGYYGHDNLGDETILTCIVNDIRGVDPDTEITVASGDPFATEKAHGVRAVLKDDFKMLTREVAKSDLVILGGGGLFQDHHEIRVSGFFENHRGGITSYSNLPLMARIYEKPVVYYSQGVGPLYSKESILFTKWAFGLADAVSVRDAFSYNVLTELLGLNEEDVQVGFDPALNLSMSDVRRGRSLLICNNIPEDKNLVLVAPRFWINETHEKRVVRELGKALRLFTERAREYYVVLIPFHRSGEQETDVRVCEEIAGYLGGVSSVVKDYHSYAEVLSLFGIADFSIGMRYHSLIFSAVAGTPMVAISYDKKDDVLMRDFEMANLCLKMKKVEYSEVGRCIDYVLDKREELHAQLIERRQTILAERFHSKSMISARIKRR